MENRKKTGHSKWTRGKLERTHRESGSMHKVMASHLVILWEYGVCEWVGRWFLCRLFGSFPSVCLSSPTSMQYFMFHLIIYSFIIPVLSKEKWKGYGSEWEGECRGIRRNRGRRNQNQDISCNKGIYWKQQQQNKQTNKQSTKLRCPNQLPCGVD